MDKFVSHTGVGVPLRRSNVDTDQIIPAVYLKRVTKSGFEDGLFAAWRQDKDFVLNLDPYASGSVLVAGSDFGTGSSREHAVWALRDYGFKVVLAPKFADIFRGNCEKDGMVAGVISLDDCHILWKLMEEEPGIKITVDLEKCQIVCGSFTCSFEIDDYTRWRLLEGLDEAALTGAVTRQDAALLLCNALPEEYTPSFWDQPIDPTALSDWGRMDSLRQEAVAELARRCVIQGKADGSFGYADPLQRCDGAVLLMRVLEQVDNSCRGESQTVTLHILNADTGEALLPDQQVETEVSTYLSSLANGLDVGYYVYDYDRETASYTSTACDSYTLYFRPMTGAEIQEEQFWEKVERGEAAYEDYYKQDFWLNFQGDNARKHILLFGDESKSRFASQEEAAAAMTTVTVPVWQLSGGEKVSSTLTLSVHAALAEDVKEIFAEIYNDPEHFPIHDVGGYAWRGDSATGEHNCGTAIDINANENYQIRDGQVLAGSCWEPGSNAYSISPDSSVVRIFAEHGWSWGGDAWAYSSDDSEGYHDYMHFSYMGE